jgi:hypothetical protein
MARIALVLDRRRASVNDIGVGWGRGLDRTVDDVMDFPAVVEDVDGRDSCFTDGGGVGFCWTLFFRLVLILTSVVGSDGAVPWARRTVGVRIALIRAHICAV